MRSLWGLAGTISPSFERCSDALMHSGLKVDKIYAIELIYQATHIPRLQMLSFIRRNKDFEDSLNYKNVDELPPGTSPNKISQISISVLIEASEKVESIIEI
ncbi:hypothetical protein J5N97_007463 [Dioscorea zingiberensis]|uniref:Uncharacterized protein n=1 Tax=Dioscorea zingiberensis TaxID=325984 RepID=A0A9D5DG40_9LILI|nr:hypothetical protein J5N97_007463 [Dioscorea zingiberensis]